MNNLFALLYTSLLAPDSSPGAITGIVHASRLNNGLLGITGMLVFDGMAFCGYLEGGKAPVTGVMEKIRADARNTDVRVLHQGPAQPPRRFQEWSLAYYSTEPLMGVFAGIEATAAVQRFEKLLPLVDRDPSA